MMQIIVTNKGDEENARKERIIGRLVDQGLKISMIREVRKCESQRHLFIV